MPTTASGDDVFFACQTIGPVNLSYHAGPADTDGLDEPTLDDQHQKYRLGRIRLIDSALYRSTEPFFSVLPEAGLLVPSQVGSVPLRYRDV